MVVGVPVSRKPLSNRNRRIELDAHPGRSVQKNFHRMGSPRRSRVDAPPGTIRVASDCSEFLVWLAVLTNSAKNAISTILDYTGGGQNVWDGQLFFSLTTKFNML